MGSVAEVERIWITAKHVLSDFRSRMTRQLFEDLLFLQYNGRFWDAQLVADAVNCSRSELSKKRLKSMYDQRDMVPISEE